MKILYERSFERDVKKIKDKRLRVELRDHKGGQRRQCPFRNKKP
jgi:hypothetical protein